MSRSIAALGAAGVLMLSACASASPAPPISDPPDEPVVAERTISTAEIAGFLETSYAEDDIFVAFDCAGNDGVIPFETGTTLECVGYADGEPPARFAFTLQVEGDSYGITVADGTNRNPAAGTPAVGSDVIEELAQQSLATIDVAAAVLCPEGDVPIEVGHEVLCNLVLDDGFGQTIVQVTSFDGDNFEVTARIPEA